MPPIPPPGGPATPTVQAILDGEASSPANPASGGVQVAQAGAGPMIGAAPTAGDALASGAGQLGAQALKVLPEVAPGAAAGAFAIGMTPGSAGGPSQTFDTGVPGVSATLAGSETNPVLRWTDPASGAATSQVVQRVGDALQVPGGGPVVGQVVNGVPVFDQAAVSALVAAPPLAGGTTTATPVPPAIPSSPPPSVPATVPNPPEGFTASPDASKPSILSTPIPDGPAAPSVTPGTPIDGVQGPTVMANQSTGNGSPATGPFTSTDPLVADLANQIEAAKPGTVQGVNINVLRPDGTIATDIDIQTDQGAIQVKSGSGKGLTSQMDTTATLTGQRTIAYGPNLGPTIIRNLQQMGYEVYTNQNDLLKALGVK